MQCVEQPTTVPAAAKVTSRSPGGRLAQAVSLLRAFSFLRISVFIGGLSFGTTLLSFASQWYVVTNYGVGSATASYFAAMVMPVFVYEVFSVTLSFVLVPYIATLPMTDRGRVAWTVVQGIGLIYLAVALLLSVMAPLLIPFLFPGFDNAARQLTLQILQVLLISLPFLTAAEVLAACYRANERFVFPESCSIVGMAGGLLTLVVASPHLGILAAAWSFVFRCVLEVVLLISHMESYQRPQWKDASLPLLWKRVRPLLLGACYYRTDAIIDRALTSLGAPGGVALLALGRQLLHAGGRLITRSVAMPMVPKLSVAARHGARRDYWKTLISRAAAVSGLCLVGLLLTWVNGEWLLRQVFARGEMTPGDVRVLRDLLLAMFGVVLGESVANLFTNAFYAIHDTHTPTRINIVAFTIGIGFRLTGFWLAGILGLAFGLSAFYILYASALVVGLYWKYGRQLLPGRISSKSSDAKPGLVVGATQERGSDS